MFGVEKTRMLEFMCITTMSSPENSFFFPFVWLLRFSLLPLPQCPLSLGLGRGGVDMEVPSIAGHSLTVASFQDFEKL